MISNRVTSVQSPPLVKLGKLATSTPDCISLGQGAPYYSPPSSLLETSLRMEDPNIHRYTEDPGIFSLRKALSEKLEQDQNIKVNPSQIVVTPGANQAFYNSLLTITDPHDEVILLTPYYFNHYMACQSINVVPVLVPHNPDFTIDIDLVEKKISSKTRAIVIVNPGNPTGMVYSKNDLDAIIELSRKHQIAIIADETYEYFTYGSQKHIPLASLNYDKVISISSFSKSFGIPGWRLGYYVAPQPVIDESIKIQDTIGICAPHISQVLGIHLLENRNELITQFVQLMRSNYQIATDLIEEVSWLEKTPSQGAYYLFPKQVTGKNTMDLIHTLIKDFGVYIVPGQGFGLNWQDYCRISFANVQEEELKEAFTRLRSYS